MHEKRMTKFNMVVTFKDRKTVVVEYSGSFNCICKVLFLLNSESILTDLEFYKFIKFII